MPTYQLIFGVDSASINQLVLPYYTITTLVPNFQCHVGLLSALSCTIIGIIGQELHYTLGLGSFGHFRKVHVGGTKEEDYLFCPLEIPMGICFSIMRSRVSIQR